MQARKVLIRILLFFLKLLLVLLVAAGIYRLGEAAYRFGDSIYDDRGAELPPGRDVVIVLPEGVSANRTAELLEEKGLVKNRWVFLVQERLSKYHGQLLPGDYVLNTSWNAEQILAVLSGQAQETTEEESGE